MPLWILVDPLRTLVGPLWILVYPCGRLVDPCGSLVDPCGALVVPCGPLVDPLWFLVGRRNLLSGYNTPSLRVPHHQRVDRGGGCTSNRKGTMTMEPRTVVWNVRFNNMVLCDPPGKAVHIRNQWFLAGHSCMDESLC